MSTLPSSATSGTPYPAPLGVIRVGLFYWTFSAVDTTASTYGNRLPSLNG
jgi:hypothetical protein